jgi:flagellar hook assembly protein FlgD
MDNTEFLSQQAMFTQVSSLQEMNEKMTKYGDALINANNSVMASNQLTQAAQMVGKDITATDPEDPTQTITGKVDSVTYGADGTISLSVNGKEIPIASISQVANHAESEEEKQSALKEKANSIVDFVLENPKLQALANSFITKLAEQLL